jgi:Xaa-Pro aminopeptidase
MKRTKSAKIPGFYPEGKLEIPQARLSLKERDRRWKLIREEMERQKIDCLVVDGCSGWFGVKGGADVRYITNAGGQWDSYAVFPMRGEPTFIGWSVAMKEWYEKVPWLNDIRVGRGRLDLALPYVAAGRVKELGYERGNIGLVGLLRALGMGGEGAISYVAYKQLCEMLPDAKLKDASTLVSDIAMIKSDEELAMVREAARIADRMIERMVALAKPGVREIEIFAGMIYEALVNGAENPMSLLWASGPEIRQAGFLPQDRMLRRGDVILTEIYTRYGGYWAHPHQPVAVGKIDRVYEECLAACLESIKVGLPSLKPGNTFDKVSKAFGEPILSAGFYHDHPCVHGIGLGAPERPSTISVEGISLPTPLGKKEVTEKESYEYFGKYEVRPGMVLALEPMACSGRKGIHIGPTVITTDNEPEIITRYGRDMIRV